MANDWLRGIVTPVVVAVIVGLVSGYMASSNALAVHGERLRHLDLRIEKLEVQAFEFAKYDARIARIEFQLSQLVEANRLCQVRP